ncbi:MULTISPECIES: DUF3883 domain-containing protein [Pseudomonas]|uniref:DUF3883 domain-containing protein n=1 Tax=Pseudomonas TaxID=286 RepID=UPI0010210A74|nr:MULTISPECIES: DUF3883 domain-containing protein [Pseudomonas]
MSKFAIKRLSRSDLTFFTWHFKMLNAGNQKSINLNAAVFVSELFPELPNVAAKKGKASFLVDVSIYGPGAAPRHSLARKIVKGEGYKNWRLNGEFVENPLDMPDRYNVLREGDFAILIFNDGMAPEELKLILVGAMSSEDVKLHASISEFMNGRSMSAVAPADLERIVIESDVDDLHAAKLMDVEGAFEDASQGGLYGVQQLQKWSGKRTISKEDLRRARENADIVGTLGEEFVDAFLQDQKNRGAIDSYQWSSSANAIEAFDFVIGACDYLDVKSTSGGFSQKIHISINELLHMRELPSYKIYRVYSMDKQSAKLRISNDMHDFAVALLQQIEPLAFGARVDTISVSPDSLVFGEEISLELKFPS